MRDATLLIELHDPISTLSIIAFCPGWPELIETMNSIPQDPEGMRITDEASEYLLRYHDHDTKH